MEVNKVEVEAVEQAVAQVEPLSLRHLEDLELALVGGGIGDVVWG